MHTRKKQALLNKQWKQLSNTQYELMIKLKDGDCTSTYFKNKKNAINFMKKKTHDQNVVYMGLIPFTGTYYKQLLVSWTPEEQNQFDLFTILLTK